MNFMQRLRAGEIDDDNIQDALDDEIDTWHEAWPSADGPEMHLHEHLGMTWDEYTKWIGSRSELRTLLDLREQT